MPLSVYIQRAIFGAWRLALYDRSGAQWFDVSINGFWRSFIAAIIVAPFYALLVASSQGAQDAGEALPDISFGAHAVDYIVGWALFPLVMVFICRLLDLGARYVPFIIAYNWSQVIVIMVLLPANYLAEHALSSGEDGGALPALLTLCVTVALLFYQWFVARVMLTAPHFTAAGIVVLDILLSVVIDVARQGIS